MRQAIFLITFLCFISILRSQEVNSSGLYASFKEKYSTNDYYRKGSKLRIIKELDKILNNIPIVDSVYLLTFKLVDTNWFGTDGLNSLSQLECKILRFYEEVTFDIIISHSYSSHSGDGNPMILISTFDKTGKLISKARMDLVYQHDFTPIPEQYFKISKRNVIIFDLRLKNYISDSEVNTPPKYINTDYIKRTYQINTSGEIQENN